MSTAVRPNFTADADGDYVLKLVVSDGALASAAATVTVTASSVNSAPVAKAGANQNVATGDLVTLDGSGSSDADGDALTYLWSFTSKPVGSRAALSVPTAVRPNFTADADGDYVLKLVVSDGALASAAATVTVTASTVHATVLSNAATPLWSFAVQNYPHNGIANAHPAVIDFLTQYGLPKWPRTGGDGWRFWGAITTVWPEDPYLFVSDDGINWRPAPASCRRLDRQSATWDDIDADFLPSNSGGSGEDIDLVYDPDKDQLVAFWVRNKAPFADGADGVTRGVVNNDLTFSNGKAIGYPVTDLSNPSNSPSIVREDANHWHMWGVFFKAGVKNGVDNKGRMTYRSSADGVTWSDYQFVDDSLFHKVFPHDTLNHLSAFPDPSQPDRVFILAQTGPTETIDDNTGGILKNGRLVLLATTYSNPTVISEVPLSDYILASSVPDSSEANNPCTPWDAGGLYRSDAQVRVVGDYLFMDLWYNGIQGIWGVTYDYGLDGTGATGPGGWIGFTSGPILPVSESSP